MGLTYKINLTLSKGAVAVLLTAYENVVTAMHFQNVNLLYYLVSG